MFPHSLTGAVSAPTERLPGAGANASAHTDASLLNYLEPSVRLEFPPTPDDIRLHSQTMSHLAQVGWSAGVTGLAMIVTGLVGLGASAYICTESTALTDDGRAAPESKWLGYAIAGSVAAISTMSTMVGLREVCRCAKKRREADRELLAMSVTVRTTSAPVEDSRDFA